MSLISRQAAIDAVYDAFCYAYCDNCEKEMNEDLCGDCHRKYQNWSASKKIIEKVINNLPSAQPEVLAHGEGELSAQPEMIRCKDCIYFDKYIDCKEMYQWDGFCADWARNTYENWYCSRAEKRNDG